MYKGITGAAAALLISGFAQAATIDFDDNFLAAGTFYDPQAATTWTDNGVTFDHGWNTQFNCCWSGFTYSNATDTTTAGFLNDRSAITGDGVGAGQDNYGVVYTGAGNSQMYFGGARTVDGGYFTNTTYAYLAMAFGDDGNDPAYVKGPFGEGDFFELTVTGLDELGQAVSSLSFLLADGADVVDSWEYFDLSGLGIIYGLDFSLNSSDIGSFGMNTPAYFAMDNLQTNVVPIPGAVWLFVSAFGVLGARRKFAAK